MGAKPQLIVKGRKFAQVLEGARTVFMRDGFERASVDDIAREAGVSKATLYAYFPDKRLLFMEIATAECRRQTDEAEALIDPDAPVDHVLRLAAEKMIAFMMSELGQRIFRIAVTEAENFPALAQDFYRSGPLLIRVRLAHYLRCGVEKSELAIADIDLAADQFAQLCKATIHEKLIFGMAETITPELAHRSVHGAVDMFLARYGVTS